MSPRFFLIVLPLLAPLARAQTAQFSVADTVPYLPISPSGDSEITPPTFPETEFSPRLSRPDLRASGAATGKLAPPPIFESQRPSEIYPYLEQIAHAFPNRVELRIYGQSASGASLVSLRISPEKPPKNLKKLAVICRQHGNEPEATASGLRLVYQFLHPRTAAQKRIAARTQLLIVPIANPDGAQIYERRTAQNIDMNRDWIARRSPEVRALVPLIAGFKPHLVVDNHQWLPGENQPVPMAESGGGSFAARRAAKIMSSRSVGSGFLMRAKASRPRAAQSLSHRFWGSRAKIPAILLETRHNPGKSGAREKAIVQATTALWGAAESLGK